MPGMTMNRWGAHMDRTQPWWFGAGKTWFKQISRGQHLLREGNAVADILWYLGDAAPTVCPEKDPLSTLVPIDINYDCLNTDMLTQLTVKDGQLTLPHGSQYKILVLNNHQTLSFDSLKTIHQLAKQGAVIVGQPVEQLSGRNVSQEQQTMFTQMVKEIWSSPKTYNLSTKANTSHGHTGVFPEHQMADSSKIDWSKIYADNNWQLDLAIEDEGQYYFTHRRSDSHDIYFIYNDNPEDKVLDAKFNISGKIPELWNTHTGEVKQLGAFDDNGQTTRVPVKIGAYDSAFVVFHQSSNNVKPVSPQRIFDQPALDIFLSAQQQPVLVSPGEETQSISGAWQVSFADFYGLDKSYTFETLKDWRDHNDPDVQNYSGTAVYEKTIHVPQDLIQSSDQLILDLGQVNIAASVSLNGREVGTSWFAPYQLDISNFVQAGDNVLKIEVANLWVNRILADKKLPDTSGFKIARWQDPITPMPKWYTDNQPPPESERITFATQVFMQDDEPTQASGLIGPVSIKTTKFKTIENN